ncbi:DsbA family protein [Gammaproteobacteria bacterium]|jgi:2-hydroxychromene-2-carboxylate isomerase|nr:DsbA family protein [Gammaproteobacteria bacterium]MDA9024658.1 DsbA family protein [Gammaproteobacteria bacterium]MDA9038560.1 DsbA family protein [Gammaproteobacteria bacterium]MDB4829410.1 DsbA family protein [Gammaproteobacteria bacterium]
MIDLYFSYRSPYSYLILPRMLKLKNESNIDINFKLVYPIAIRMPEWFEKKNMFFFLSTMSDFKKKAKQLGMPLNLPVKPDPIKQNIFTAKIAEDQPYIFDICHMGQEMTNRGFGLEFAHKLSTKIWSVKNWNMDEHLIEILSKFNIELSEIRETIKKNESTLIEQIKQNQVEQLEAGHHGVPLSVYKEEYFFGQDKFDDLIERMKINGDI